MTSPKRKLRRAEECNRVEAFPRFGPQERALRVAIDKASVFASQKRHEEGMTRIQTIAVRETIPAIVTGLAALDRRRIEAKRWHGEMTEYAFRANEDDATLWLLWLDVVRNIFKPGVNA